MWKAKKWYIRFVAYGGLILMLLYCVNLLWLDTWFQIHNSIGRYFCMGLKWANDIISSTTEELVLMARQDNAIPWCYLGNGELMLLISVKLCFKLVMLKTFFFWLNYSWDLIAGDYRAWERPIQEFSFWWWRHIKSSLRSAAYAIMPFNWSSISTVC